MIHYSCDMCGKPLHSDKDVRYIVKVEVYCVYEEDEDFDEEDEIFDEFEDIDDDETGADEEEEYEGAEYKTFRFDLCCECHSKYLQNPLFVKDIRKTRFSEN